MNLTHINENNNPTMVDVGDKTISERTAKASGIITMNKDAFAAIKNNTNKKGPVLQCAIIAGIMGAKKTSEIIPMCHNIIINKVDIQAHELENNSGFRLISEVKCSGKTGVEMEALNAVSIALLTIYDMLKAIDKSMIISDIKLLEKSGGKSGDFVRE